MRRCIVGIKRDRLLEQPARGQETAVIQAIDGRHRQPQQVLRGSRLRAACIDPFTFPKPQPRFEPRRRAAGKPILQGEDVGDGMVKALRPDHLATCTPIRQAQQHPQSVIAALHHATEQVVDVRLRLPGRARNAAEPAKPRQCDDELLGQARCDLRHSRGNTAAQRRHAQANARARTPSAGDRDGRAVPL
jgi:hypothetical protein